MARLTRHLHRLALLSTAVGLTALALACTPQHPATPVASDEDPEAEEPPPSPAEVEAAVKQGMDAACTSDTDCAMYLRCSASQCKAPMALDGTILGDGPVPAAAIITKQREAQFYLELARSAEERMRGLMFRPRMNDGWGMLFVYPGESPLTFWMKNTYIPLDMVFISADHHVVGVVENATPFTLESRKVEGKSQYVLEVNAGMASKYGIAAGDKVVFANLP